MTGKLRWICATVLILTLALLMLTSERKLQSTEPDQSYRVQPQRIQQTFVFSGDVNARTETVVTSGVYNLGEYDNTYIIRVAEDGASVKEGEIILELDAMHAMQRDSISASAGTWLDPSATSIRSR